MIAAETPPNWASGDRAGAQAAGEVECVVDRGEVDFGAEAVAARADPDLASEGGAQGVGDARHRLDLVGVQAAGGAAVLRCAASGRGGRSGAGFRRPDRPALAYGVAGQ